MLHPKPEHRPGPKSQAFMDGFEEAQRAFETQDDPEYINPFPEGTDHWNGYEEGVYTFTQK